MDKDIHDYLNTIKKEIEESDGKKGEIEMVRNSKGDTSYIITHAEPGLITFIQEGA